MEREYGHMIDYVLVMMNGDLDRAFDELQRELNRLEVEPQWVPSRWLRHSSLPPAAFASQSVGILDMR